MRGDNHLLAVTTRFDEISQTTVPIFSFPVQICKAVEEKTVKFDWATASGDVRKRVWRGETTGEICTDDECIMGIRLGDEFKPVPQEAVKAIAEQTKITTMIALGTVDLDTLDFGRTVERYFVQCPSKGGSPKAYRILYEALLAEDKALVVKRTVRTRQQLGVILADPTMKCLTFVAMHFAGDLRDPDAQILAPQTATVEAKQILAARKVLTDALPDATDALATEFDAAVPLKAAIVERALNGDALPAMPIPVSETTASDDLMGLLEASLAAAAA